MSRSNCYLLIVIMSRAVHLSFLYCFPPLLSASVLSCYSSSRPSPRPKMGSILFTSEAYSSHSWDSLPWVLCFVLFFFFPTNYLLGLSHLYFSIASFSNQLSHSQADAVIFFKNFIHLLAMLHCFQDLSSLTRDGAWAMAVKAWNPNH